MKKLFLIRHAHAADNSGGLSDHERPLSQEGMRQASRLGKFFMINKMVPQRLVTSTAVRARMTAEMMADQMKLDDKYLLANEDLYESSVRLMLNVITSLDNEWDIVGLVSHNPSIPYLGEYLTKQEITHMDPASCASITFELDDWKEISEGNGNLEKLHHISDIVI